RGSYGSVKPKPPDIFIILIVAVNLPNFAVSIWRFWKGRSGMGPRLYVFSRPGDVELTWSGRVLMLMSVLLFLLVLTPAMWVGWLGAMVQGITVMLLGWVGYQIAESLGRVELRAGGVLRGAVF